MRLVKRVSLVLVLSVFFVGVPKGFAEPRDGWSLEGRVPSSSMAMLSIEDVAGMGAKFEKTAIMGLFREPEMQAFAKPIGEQLAKMMESERGSPFGEATPLVMKLLEQLTHLRGQLAVALLDVDAGRGMPRAVLSLDFGQHVGDFAQFLEGMRQEIDPDGKALRSFEKDGRTWWQVEDGPPITATTVDTAFVAATDPALLEGVVAGAGEGSLAASADFRSVRTRAGGDQLAVFAYANVPAIVEKVTAEMPADARRIAMALGLDTVRAAAYGMAFSGDGFMDSFIVHAPDASHGIVPLLSMPAYEPKALARVPAGAFYYEEGAANFAELLPNVRKLVKGVEPNAVEQMDGFLDQINAQLGVDLEKDVLGGMAGGACSYVSMPETGGLFPELAVMLQVKDPAGFEATFARLAQGIAGAVSEEGDVIASTRTLDYRGTPLHLFEMQRARGRDVVPFTPTWALLDDWLVITLVPHTMKEIVLRGKATDGLASQEDFQSLRRAVPAGAGEMSYLDMQAVLSLLYDTGVPLLQTAVKPNVMGRQMPFTLDWALLPAARTVRPYFRSLGIYTTWNKDGLAIQMHGPLPMAGLFMVAAAVAVPMALGGVRRVRAVPMRRIRPTEEAKGEPAPRVEPGPGALTPKDRMARVQAEQIGSYVRVFLLTQKRLPASLDELVKENVASSLPKDPWGKDFMLVVTDAKTRSFVVRSAGADGTFGTDDDVESSN